MPTRLRPGSALAVLLLSGCLTGCKLTQPAPVKQAFLLHVAQVQATRPRQAGALQVGRFRVAAPFEGKGLVYRTGELRYESDFYNEFFVSPAVMVTERVAERLAQARPFDAVLGSGNGLEAPWRLQGLVTELYGDVRERGRPAAVLAIQFYLVRADEVPERVVYDRSLRRQVALPDASPEALARGLGTALEQILSELDADLRALALPDRLTRAGDEPCSISSRG
jgi:cholesterol transport system auxiliary component